MITWRMSGSGRVAIDETQGRRGGRWHSAGRPLLYTADACALAVMEFVVHLETPPPATLVAVALDVPDSLAADTLTLAELPDDWRRPDSVACRRAGDAWLACPMEERAAILCVPSAVVPQHRNWLLDPCHPDAARIRVVSEYATTLDERLLDPRQRRCVGVFTGHTTKKVRRAFI